MDDSGELAARFPDLNVQDLEEHVKRMEARQNTFHPERERAQRVNLSESGSQRGERSAATSSIGRNRSRSQRRGNALQRAASSSGPRFRRSLDRVAPSREERGRDMCRRSDASKSTRRKRRGESSPCLRPELPLSEVTRQETPSGPRSQPVKLEPGEDSVDEVSGITTPDECDSDVSWTVRSSDESDASIFGLRHMLHEVEEGSEISAASSDDDNEIAVAERKAVAEWRIAEGMEWDMDFAYCSVSFEEAYKVAGQPVAVAWSTARILACPELASDMAKISKIDATTTKIAKVNEQRRNVVSKKRRVTSAAFLRQPGKGTEVEEEDADKQRFVEPLARLMMDCKVGHAENISASNDEIMSSLRRKASRLVATSEIPTLHRAITTAAELRKYLEERPTYG